MFNTFGPLREDEVLWLWKEEDFDSKLVQTFCRFVHASDQYYKTILAVIERP